MREGKLSSPWKVCFRVASTRATIPNEEGDLRMYLSFPGRVMNLPRANTGPRDVRQKKPDFEEANRKNKLGERTRVHAEEEF